MSGCTFCASYGLFPLLVGELLMRLMDNNVDVQSVTLLDNEVSAMSPGLPSLFPLHNLPFSDNGMRR